MMSEKIVFKPGKLELLYHLAVGKVSSHISLSIR